MCVGLRLEWTAFWIPSVTFASHSKFYIAFILQSIVNIQVYKQARFMTDMHDAADTRYVQMAMGTSFYVVKHVTCRRLGVLTFC